MNESVEPGNRGERMPSEVKEFVEFREMITPAIIQRLFWVGVALAILLGIGSMKRSVWAGLGILVLGPILLRVQCEMIIIFFRIYDVLVKMRDDAKKAT